MKILAEESRLKSLNNLLNAVGFQEVLYEDFVEETISLLRQTATSIPCQDNGAGLLHSFNDAGMSNAIITHFRVSNCGRGARRLAFIDLTLALAYHERMDENPRRHVPAFLTRQVGRRVLCNVN